MTSTRLDATVNSGRPPLSVRLTRTFKNEPLAVVDGLPGGSAEMRPADLRALAHALLRIADHCESRPATGRNWSPQARTYPVDQSAV